MKTPTNIVRLRQPEEINDFLSDVLRAGVRRLLVPTVETEADALPPRNAGPAAAGRSRGWCGTATNRSGRPRPASARCRWRGVVSEIVARWDPRTEPVEGGPHI